MSTKRKNASLSALETGLAREVSPQEVRDESPQVSPVPDSAAAPQKKKKIQLPTYPPAPVHEQLRRLAFEERTSINALTLEAWDLLFKQRGLKSVEALTQDE
jgi:hypothetical protein